MNEILSKVAESLKKGDVDKEKLKKMVQEYESLGDNIKELLQFATEIQPNDKEINNLYKSFSAEHSSKLVEDFRNIGDKYSHKEIKKTFKDQGYRLLEQIRLGRREEVFYGILRIFVSHSEEFPLRLIEAFKPVYSDQMFKIFLFSFLSGILREEKTE